jgi:2-aminophenol/2-amino-5-chlorophenol 1,6-dioxygenase beta subunit
MWDMKMLQLMKKGNCKDWLKLIPQFNKEAIAETNSGGLNWMMAAMGYPEYPAKVHGYGNVIGTGNAVASWIP